MDIFEACRTGNLKRVKELINTDATVNINVGDICGDTPLHNACYACYYKNLDIIKFLVNTGADLNIKNMWGNTILDIAKKNNKKDIVEFLESQKLVKAAIKPKK